jgi:hypothetical protein
MNLRRARHYNYVDKVRIFLDEALKRHAAYHIWFHPSDPTELFQHEFHEVIQEMAARRRAGQLWVTTMANLTSYCEARKQTDLEVRRRANDLTIALRSDYDAKRYGDTKLTLRISSDRLPANCLVQTRDCWETVKWTSENPHKGKREPCSFLVDVPINAQQLLVYFGRTHASRREPSATVASSALA